MKKVFLLMLFALASGISQGQISDTLIRSTGFFVSPALTGLDYDADSISPSPRFGLSAGYRFVNKLKHGFFIESGVNYTWLGASYPTQTFNVMAYGRNWTYTEDKTSHQMFLSVPFLVGYKMNTGKVRFQGSLGYSINLKFSDYSIIKKGGNDPFSVSDEEKTGDVLTFGTGISAIVKAGISIPLTKRMTLDILPAARYQFISFKTGSMDMIEDMSTDTRNWSAGLDIGFIWALDNAEPEIFEEKTVKKEVDYTFQYKADDELTSFNRRLKPWGYKNYIYLEVAGNSLVYSANYERDVFDKGALSVMVRGGFGIFGEKYAIPVGGSIMLGRGTKKFEAGLYSNFENFLLDEFNVNIVPALAFRWVTEEHFFMRLSVMSHIVVGTGEIMPGIGLSVGGGF